MPSTTFNSKPLTTNFTRHRRDGKCRTETLHGIVGAVAFPCDDAVSRGRTETPKHGNCILPFVLALFQQVRKTSTAGVGTAGPGPGPAPGTGKTSPPASPGGPAAAKAKKMRKDSAASGAGQLLFAATVKDRYLSNTLVSFPACTDLKSFF